MAGTTYLRTERPTLIVSRSGSGNGSGGYGGGARNAQLGDFARGEGMRYLTEEEADDGGRPDASACIWRRENPRSHIERVPRSHYSYVFGVVRGIQNLPIRELVSRRRRHAPAPGDDRAHRNPRNSHRKPRRAGPYHLRNMTGNAAPRLAQSSILSTLDRPR